jgi:hypothetical protein
LRVLFCGFVTFNRWGTFRLSLVEHWSNRQLTANPTFQGFVR